MQNVTSAGDQYFVSFADNILTPLYQLAVGIAFAYFLYGVAMFIFKMNDQEARTNGKNHLLYGTIGLFIMFSIGGIFSIFTSLFEGVFGK